MALAYGIFFDNSYRSYFDFGRNSQQYAAFGAEGGEMNYYFFYGPAIKKILSRYTELTGRMPMPPMWALGNQQSRWSYYPDTMAEEVVRQYRERDLPLDVLHLDIDYMQGYRVFTWNTDRFPNPKAFTDKLKQQGVKVVTIVDPGREVSTYCEWRESSECRFQQSRTEAAGQKLLRLRSGHGQRLFSEATGWAAFHPASLAGRERLCRLHVAGRAAWWGDLHRAYTDNGVAGIWTRHERAIGFR